MCYFWTLNMRKIHSVLSFSYKNKDLKQYGRLHRENSNDLIIEQNRKKVYHTAASDNYFITGSWLKTNGNIMYRIYTWKANNAPITYSNRVTALQKKPVNLQFYIVGIHLRWIIIYIYNKYINGRTCISECKIILSQTLLVYEFALKFRNNAFHSILVKHFQKTRG